MQNTLAALSPIASIAEVVGSAVPAIGVDGLFGETFVEVVSTAEPLQKADETAVAGLVSPMAWGGLFLVNPTPPLSATIASGQNTVPVSDGALIEDLPSSSTSSAVEGVFAPVLQQSTRPLVEETLASAANGLSLRSAAGEDRLLESLPTVLGKRPERDQAVPVPTMTAGPMEILKPVPLADLAGVAPAEATGPRTPGLTDHAGLADHSAEGPLAAVNGLPASKNAVAAVDPEHKPTWQEATTIPATTARPVLMKDAGEMPVDRPVVDSGAASALPVRAVPTENGAVDQADLSAVPTLRPVTQTEPSAGPTLADPAGHSAEVKDVTGLSAETGKDPVDLDLSADPTVDEGSGRTSQIVSFWERFFSTKSAETASQTPSRQDVPSAMVVPSPGATLISVGSGSVSEPESEIAATQATSAPGSAIERPTFPALSAAAAWSREQLVNSLSKALPQMMFADWPGDLSLSDQRAELSLSAYPAPSGGAAHVSPTTPGVSPHFPVPHIASQIASVLVRNESSVTELALAPEELGKIRLRMEPDSANPDRMVILISVERPETLDLFRRHAGDLAEAIRSAGYSGADIGFGQNTQDNGSGHRREAASAGPGSRFEEVGPVETARPHTLGASLDLRL